MSVLVYETEPYIRTKYHQWCCICCYLSKKNKKHQIYHKFVLLSNDTGMKMTYRHTTVLIS